MTLRLYISGPMTGQPNLNREGFAVAERWLRMNGIEAVNPHAFGQSLGAPAGEVPSAHLRSKYLRRDFEEIAKSNGLFLLEGWSGSRGARLEVLVARLLALPLYQVKDDRLVLIASVYSQTLIHAASSQLDNLDEERRGFQQ